ncbi:MAG: hypothetical protein OXC62_14465 [Aestuariivita sp.]|nr:hypothetical protein [Aestuariivita sp.]
MTKLSREIALYGTEEVVTPPQVLTAGDLTVELEAGNLRYIRWQGEEVLRAISFIVRDKDWGTYSPEITEMAIDIRDDSFEVTLKAIAKDSEQSFSYDARVEGSSTGKLTFHSTGRTEGNFFTNRTGFVILHPINGLIGAPVTIEHTNGNIKESTFPAIIDPVQPMMDLRALTHHTPSGILVRTLMEGDIYEMEDQRNWTDSSYKTYVRPLSLPWPYKIEAGDKIDQKITVEISGSANKSANYGTVPLSVGDALGSVPPIGLGLRPEDTATTMTAADTLRALNPSYLILHHDPRSGHDQATLSAMLKASQAINTESWLELVVVSTDNTQAEEEILAIGKMAAVLGSPFETVLVSPASDMKCTLPGSVWPETPDAADLYRIARKTFPKAKIGGGMFSYFTELNRKRPPTDMLDLVSFTTSPVVHAGDDRSVMETHEAHFSIINSVTEISSGVPWVLGPSAIGMRDNPYGSSTKYNSENIRQAMNWNDPRQRGLMGAAWTLGYIADFAIGGAAAVSIGGCTGPFGVVFSPAAYPQPWFDDYGGLYPVFHVLRGFAQLKNCTMLTLEVPPPAIISGIAARSADGSTTYWITNTKPEPVTVEITEPGLVKVAILCAANFIEATKSVDFMDRLVPHSSMIKLDSFAIARIEMKV